MTRFRPVCAPLLAIAVWVSFGVPCDAHAEPWVLFGARQQSMGGAGVATVNDASAQYWNPGAMAFGKMLDVRGTLGAQADIEGGVIEEMDQAFDAARDLKQQIDDVVSGELLAPGDVEELAGFVTNELGKFDSSGEGFVVSGDISLLARSDRLAIGQIFLASSAVQPVLDNDALSISTDPLGGPEQVFNVVRNGVDHSVGSAQPFAQAGSQSLANEIAAVAANWSQDQAEEFVFRAERGDVDTADSSSRGRVLGIAKDTGAGGEPDISLNNTGALVRGIVTSETGLSFGIPLELPHVPGKLGVGMNVKLMLGTTFNTLIEYDEVDSVGDVIDDVFGAKNSKTSFNVGIDLGVMAKPRDWVTLGLVARNINSPSFDLEGSGTYTLNPQVRFGVAIAPISRLVVALDVDLTNNDSEGISGFRSRQIGFGIEYLIPFKEVKFALRTGGWTNLSGNLNDTLAWTGGIGLGWRRLTLDLAFGSSFDTVHIEGTSRDKWPSRANFALTFAWTSFPD